MPAAAAATAMTSNGRKQRSVTLMIVVERWGPPPLFHLNSTPEGNNSHLGINGGDTKREPGGGVVPERALWKVPPEPLLSSGPS